MKIPISEVPERYPKLVLMFEEETGKNAIWGNRLTYKFKYWLHQKLKYKNLICIDPTCPDYDKEFPSKMSLAQHNKWHKKRYRKKMKEIQKEVQNRPEVKEKISKANKEVWNRTGYREKLSGEKAPNYGRTGNKHPMFDKRGEDNPNWDKNGIHYNYTHLKAHKIDPKPKDGICAYCHKVTDKKGKTKLIHSNKDHSYKLPIVPDEWWWIHYSCHMKYDIEKDLR